ncbi:MAG: hypothetical protein ACYCZF_03540 [Anaerolineae bacterium]
MNALGLIFGWIANSIAYLAEISVYFMRSIWISIVRASLVLLEGVDDWFPDLGILENGLLRLLVMAVVGFFLGVVLMIFFAFVMGAWCIPCSLVMTIGFCAFVGLLADPDRDWSFGDFPSFGNRGNPQTPVNL